MIAVASLASRCANPRSKVAGVFLRRISLPPISAITSDTGPLTFSAWCKAVVTSAPDTQRSCTTTLFRRASSLGQVSICPPTPALESHRLRTQPARPSAARWARGETGVRSPSPGTRLLARPIGTSEPGDEAVVLEPASPSHTTVIRTANQ